MTKVMRKEAPHTQRRDRASGVPLEILDPWKPACEALQSKPKNTGMVGTVLTREAGPGEGNTEGPGTASSEPLLPS